MTLLVSNNSIQVDIMTIVVIVEIDHLVATEIVTGTKAERTRLRHGFSSQEFG
jgi:hypothetical protein